MKIKKCACKSGTEHIKVGKNKVKVTITLDNESETWILYHLANKYADGCMSAFSKEVLMSSVRENFMEEVKKDIDNHEKKEEGNGTTH